MSCSHCPHRDITSWALQSYWVLSSEWKSLQLQSPWLMSLQPQSYPPPTASPDLSSGDESDDSSSSCSEYFSDCSSVRSMVSLLALSAVICFWKSRNSKTPRNPFSASCTFACFLLDNVFSEFPVYCFGVFHFCELIFSFSSWIMICWAHWRTAHKWSSSDCSTMSSSSEWSGSPSPSSSKSGTWGSRLNLWQKFARSGSISSSLRVPVHHVSEPLPLDSCDWLTGFTLTGFCHRGSHSHWMQGETSYFSLVGTCQSYLRLLGHFLRLCCFVDEIQV